MKTKYILDGYNVIHKIPQLADRLVEGLVEAREALAFHIINWKRNHLYDDICIVFDGRDQLNYPSSHVTIKGVECYFTKTGQEADDYIIDIVRCTHKSTHIIVISDDNKIRNNCKVYGVEVRHPSTLEVVGVKLSRALTSSGNKVSSEDASDITKWYKDRLGLTEKKTSRKKSDDKRDGQ